MWPATPIPRRHPDGFIGAARLGSGRFLADRKNGAITDQLFPDHRAHCPLCNGVFFVRLFEPEGSDDAIPMTPDDLIVCRKCSHVCTLEACMLNGLKGQAVLPQSDCNTLNPRDQATLRRFAAVGRTKLREEGMTDAEIDAAINEAVCALQAANAVR